MAKEETIQARVKVEGEKEYRAACKNINSSLREIGSEMKLLTAEFGSNADSSEALTKKQEILKKQLDEQAQKASAAEAALEKMRSAGIEPTDTAFQKMQTNLNNTKAEMIKTQAEIDGITESLNKTTPASAQFAAEAEGIDKQLGLLASEMKVVSAEYENNADSAEALKAKQTVLKQVFEEQQNKVEALEKAYRAATVEYGENSDEAIELKKSLNECTAEMKSTENQIDKINDSLNKSKINWESVGNAVATGTKAFAVGVAAVATAAAGLAYKIGTEVVSAYADFEQLIGGVETLFGNASDEVTKNAEKAFKTAGLSANEYMETVTAFSASLISSLGGDTEKAAKYADMAITDMSDNANKMGSDMASIQNAYQGFAKQNYTMLDNLKLGYGGTKEEMQRLLEDATALSGIEYDISSYADIVDAIHVIQTEMGITGTTAKEAEATISGSLSMLSSAYDNFITGLGNADADMNALVGDIADSFSAVVKNITPVINNIVEAIPTAANAIVGAIGDILPTLLNTVTTHSDP